MKRGLSRRRRQEAEVDLFVRQSGRKAQKGADPNDRRYDRDVQRKIERMSPVDLDRLLRGGE